MKAVITNGIAIPGYAGEPLELAAAKELRDSLNRAIVTIIEQRVIRLKVQWPDSVLEDALEWMVYWRDKGDKPMGFLHSHDRRVFAIIDVLLAVLGAASDQDDGSKETL